MRLYILLLVAALEAYTVDSQAIEQQDLLKAGACTPTYNISYDQEFVPGYFWDKDHNCIYIDEIHMLGQPQSNTWNKHWGFGRNLPGFRGNHTRDR